MFQDLDRTLNAIIEDPQVPEVLRQADVSFETPDKEYAPAGPRSTCSCTR